MNDANRAAGASKPVSVPDPEASLVPVTVQPEDHGRPPRDEIAMCLSGGGTRAMLFHAGALLRLNQAGILSEIACFSSVSGGSIAAAAMAVAWDGLDWQGGVARNFEAAVVTPLRNLATPQLDVLNWIAGTLMPRQTPATRFADVLDKRVYHGMTLDALPDRPLFIFNSTNLASGVDWRFSKAEMGDYRVGRIVNARGVRVATAVAASSAFPPAYSPLWLEFPDGQIPPATGRLALRDPAYRQRVPLADGGAYDNLGLEPVWKAYATVLVSDGGGETKAEPRPRLNPASQTVRVMKLIDRQVRSLRKRMLIAGYRSKLRAGAYWGIRTNIEDYELSDPLEAPWEATLVLAAEPTRLTTMPSARQDRLINWGYAVADAAIRKHFRPGTARGAFPYPGGVGPRPKGPPPPAAGDPVVDDGG